MRYAMKLFFVWWCLLQIGTRQAVDLGESPEVVSGAQFVKVLKLLKFNFLLNLK